MSNEMEALVKTAIQTQIVRAFRDAPEAIDKLVEAAMSSPVGEHGGKPDAYNRRTMPFLEWLVGDTIRGIARAAVEEAVMSHRDKIQASVAHSLQTDDIVKAVMTKILGATDEDYKLRVTFVDENND